MLLSALLAEPSNAKPPQVIGDPNIEIAGLAADSRSLKKGELFAALSGIRVDGGRFIDDALKQGAAAVLGSSTLDQRALPVPLVLDDNPRRRLALMAARFFETQPKTVVAVTGTNGKTSVAHYCREFWSAAGHRAASLGTLGLNADGMAPEMGLTTPEPIALHRRLAELEQGGIDHLALEASSHGLAQYRLDGVRFSAAAFTHISRDHYDYHGSYEAYFAAKQRLFTELMPERAKLVLNADIPEFSRLSAKRFSSQCVLDYGVRARVLKLVDVTAHTRGLGIEVELKGRRALIETRLIGSFQAHNLLAAMGLVLATGGSIEQVIESASSVRAPKGRMELIVEHPSGAACIVDYAHTPDAIASALKSLRPHTRGRLHIVFGCGGDRDPGKRPLMGRAAARYADHVYVTDDNPRSEDPGLIRKATLEGCPDAREIGDRAEVIATAYRALHEGDVLLVAGKGHETGQIVKDQVLPFDDAVELRKLAGQRP